MNTKLLIIIIELFNLFQNDAWGCDYIEVKYKDQMEVFPLYDWVTEEIAITASKGIFLVEQFFACKISRFISFF